MIRREEAMIIIGIISKFLCFARRLIRRVVGGPHRLAFCRHFVYHKPSSHTRY